jgi:hypothetical protein
VRLKVFDERVLIGLAGLDVPDRDVVLLAPVGEALSRQLRAVVDPHRVWAAVDFDDCSSTRPTRAAGSALPTSIASASRFASSTTLRYETADPRRARHA